MQVGMETESLAQLADPLTLQRAVLDPGGLSPRAMPGLQRSFGNQYVQMMLNGVAQREPADDVAAQMQAQISADHGSQPGNGGSAQITQRESGDGGGIELPDSTSDAINQGANSGGKSLPEDAQIKLKQNLGVSDPENIQVHHDAKSDALAQSLGARAFTTGGDIFFRQGEYDPGSTKGKRLLYHEGVHTVQQGGVKQKSAQPKMTVTPAGDQYEQEADAIAEQALAPEQGQPRLIPPDTSDIPDSELPIQMEEEEEGKEEEEEVSEEEKEKKRKEAKQETSKEKDEKKKEAKGKGKSEGEEKKAKQDEKAGSKLPKKPKTPQEKTTPKPDTSALGDIDGDFATETKFDPEEFEPEEPDTGPLLPNWDQLAAGTVQLQADVGEEYSYHSQLSEGGFEGLGTTAGEAEGFEVESEPIDQAAMANEALKEGILGGLEEGATSFLADQAVEAATSKIPYADGLINMVQLAQDPNKWLHDNVFAIGDGAKAIASGFSAIGEESTGWGTAAAVLEFVISIIDFVNSIIGLINQIFTIILFISKMMVILSNFMIGLAPVGFPIFPFAWTPALFGPVLSIFSAIISFLDPINTFIGTIANILSSVKFGLQPIVIFLRYMDLRECKADPEKLKEKQAKLQDTTKGFTAAATTKVMNKTKDAGVNAYQKRKLRKETKGELNDLDALEGASKPKKGDDEAEEAFQTRKSQAEQDFEAAKQRYVEAHGDAPEKKANESDEEFEQRKKKAADEFYESAKPPTAKGFLKGAAKIAALGIGVDVGNLAKLKNVAKPFTKKGRASLKKGVQNYVADAKKEHQERTGGGTFMKPGKAQERADYVARAKRSHEDVETKRRREEITGGEQETASTHARRRREAVTEKEQGEGGARTRLTEAEDNVTRRQDQVTAKRQDEETTRTRLTEAEDNVRQRQDEVATKRRDEENAHTRLTEAEDNVTRRQGQVNETEQAKTGAERRKNQTEAEVISHKRKLDDQNEVVRELDRQVANKQKSAQTDDDRAEIERLKKKRESAQEKADELTIEHTRKQTELDTARDEEITARKSWYEAEQSLTRAQVEQGEVKNNQESARQDHETANNSLSRAREQETERRNTNSRATREREEAEETLTRAREQKTEAEDTLARTTREREEAQGLLDPAREEERRTREAYTGATREREEAETEQGQIRGGRPKVFEGVGEDVGGLPKWLGGKGDTKHQAWWLSGGKHGGQRHGPGVTGPGGSFVLGLAKPSEFLGEENQAANNAQAALNAYNGDNTQMDQLEAAKQIVFWDLFSPQYYRDETKKFKYTSSDKSDLRALADRLAGLRTSIETAYSGLGVGASGVQTAKKKTFKIKNPQIWGPGNKDQEGISGFTKLTWAASPGDTAYTVTTAYATDDDITALTWEGEVLQPDVTPKKLKLDPGIRRGVKYKDNDTWSDNKVAVAYEYQPVGKKVSRPTGSEIEVQIAHGFKNYLNKSNESVVEKLNVSPSFSDVPSGAEAHVGQAFSAVAHIGGDDNPVLTDTASKPNWLNHDLVRSNQDESAQINLEGTPAEDDVGQNSVKLDVEDKYGESSTVSFNINVLSAESQGVSRKVQRSLAISGGNGRTRSQIIQAKRVDEEPPEAPSEAQASKSIQLAPDDERMPEQANAEVTHAPGFGKGAGLEAPAPAPLTPPPQTAPARGVIQMAPAAEDEEPAAAPADEMEAGEEEEAAALDAEETSPEVEAEEEEAVALDEEGAAPEVEIESGIEATAEGEEEALAESAEMEEEEGGVDAGYASLAAQAHEARLYSLLPPPPEGVIDRVQGAAAAYSHLDAEEYDLYQQREEIGGLAQHGQGQMVELQGVRTLNAANQAGVAAHQRDVETQLQAQDEMSNASSAQEGQAKKTAGEGEQGSNFLNKVFGKIMEGLGFGGAAGADSSGGQSQSGDMKSGTQTQAKNTQAASTLTKDAQGLTKQRTGETTQVKGEAQQVQDDLNDFDDQMLGEQESTQEGIGELEDAGGMNEEGLENVQGEKERLQEEHSSAWEEAHSWAEEHHAVREDVFSQLEADLVEPPAEPGAVEELAAA